MTVDLLCMGEPMLEFNQLPPNPDGTQHYLEGHGGDTSNAAIAAARQGASVGYITALGQDMPGDSFISLWQRENVDISTVLRTDRYQTGVYFVTHDARGHHFLHYRTNSAAAMYAPSDVPEAAIKAARMLYVSGISQGISTTACDAVFKAIDVARAQRRGGGLRHQLPPPAVAAGEGRRGDARGDGARRLRHAGAGGRVDADRPDRPGQDAGFLLAAGLQSGAAEDGRGGFVPGHGGRKGADPSP